MHNEQGQYIREKKDRREIKEGRFYRWVSPWGEWGAGVEPILTTANIVVFCTISDPCVARTESLTGILEQRSGCVMCSVPFSWFLARTKDEHSKNRQCRLFKRLPVCPWLIWKEVCFSGGRCTLLHECTIMGTFKNMLRRQFNLVSLKLACYCANTAIMFHSLSFLCGRYRRGGAKSNAYKTAWSSLLMFLFHVWSGPKHFDDFAYNS